MAEHKYHIFSGYPTFWMHIAKSIIYKKDNLDKVKCNYTNAILEPHF